MCRFSAVGSKQSSYLLSLCRIVTYVELLNNVGIQNGNIVFFVSIFDHVTQLFQDISNNVVDRVP